MYVLKFTHIKKTHKFLIINTLFFWNWDYIMLRPLQKKLLIFRSIDFDDIYMWMRKKNEISATTLNVPSSKIFNMLVRQFRSFSITLADNSRYQWYHNPYLRSLLMWAADVCPLISLSSIIMTCDGYTLVLCFYLSWTRGPRFIIYFFQYLMF